jgi:hypothetical protein
MISFFRQIDWRQSLLHGHEQQTTNIEISTTTKKARKTKERAVPHCFEWLGRLHSSAAVLPWLRFLATRGHAMACNPEKVFQIMRRRRGRGRGNLSVYFSVTKIDISTKGNQRVYNFYVSSIRCTMELRTALKDEKKKRVRCSIPHPFRVFSQQKSIEKEKKKTVLLISHCSILRVDIRALLHSNQHRVQIATTHGLEQAVLCHLAGNHLRTQKKTRKEKQKEKKPEPK